MSLSSWRRTQISRYHIQRFFYFSLIENLESMLTHGILSKNVVVETGFQSASFAEESVQERRHGKLVELSDYSRVPLHSLVPLYLTPRTPTLSARRKIQTELFFFDISLDAVCDDTAQFAFTNGNAGASQTNFYRSLYKLPEIPWDVIFSEYWNDHVDGRRKRCCEFLIYPSIPVKYFERLVVIGDLQAQQCQRAIAQAGLYIQVDISTNYFFA